MNLPKISLSISETHLALVELRSRGGDLEARHLGVMQLPAGVVVPHFTEPNIPNESTFIDYLNRTAQQADLTRARKLMVTLPETSAHSFVIVLESVPNSRAELEQMIEWKAERQLGTKAADMKISSRQLETGSGTWLVSSIHRKVLEQYERIFAQMNWQAGVIVPQHLGEAQWLMRAGLTEDQVMVSTNPRGFVVVITRGDEPLLVREVYCSASEAEDEFFRLMIYYRDRLKSAAGVSRLLVIGSNDEQERFRRTLESALETRPVTLNPQSIGFNLEATAPFNRLAAAAGLASMGC
jgi:Tfp pilus assembly PilM family ATPase